MHPLIRWAISASGLHQVYNFDVSDDVAEENCSKVDSTRQILILGFERKPNSPKVRVILSRRLAYIPSIEACRLVSSKKMF